MVLKFFAETPIVKGYNRGCVYDLPRENYHFIPNLFIVKILNLENQSENNVYSVLSPDEELWLELMLLNEYCFFIPTVFANSFPKINFQWKSPSLLTNTIIDVDCHNLNKTQSLKFLQDVGCKHILFRVYNADDLEGLTDYFIAKLNNLTFFSIDFVIEKNMLLNAKKMKQFQNDIFKSTNYFCNYSFLKKEKRINFKYFRPNFLINIKVFTEALHHNTYFNGKLHIDVYNNFKNGIEADLVNYNIPIVDNILDFKKQVSLKSLKKLWNVSKDKIDVCKNCEFRYMCVDNRIPIKRKNDEYYFEKECAYNPFISKWNTEVGFKSLQEIKVTSNKDGFNINKDFIADINNKLWADA